MNSQDAKEILRLYRPGSPEAADPQLAQALQQAQSDPELAQWLERSCAFHTVMTEKFRQIPVPSGLKESILAGRNLVRPLWWQRPAWFTAAAAALLLLGFWAAWLRPEAQDKFTGFRLRMVRNALHRYHMDIVTNNQQAIRQFMARSGAPSDYLLTPPLEKLKPTGGGLIHWRGNPVSMVCFDRGDKQMVFLFVVNRSSLRDAPATSEEKTRVSKLLTSSWSEGDKTYLLAGPEDSAVFRGPKR